MTTAAIHAELIKFFSTRGWLIGLLCLLGFGMILPVGNAMTANVGSYTVTNSAGLGGVADFGLLVLMVVAAVSVTQEYRYGTARVSLLALPERWPWLVAKGIFMTLIAALSSAVLAILGILAVQLLADPVRQDGVSVLTAAPLLVRVVLVAMVMALLAIGVAALVRNTATTVAIIVLWPTVVELLLAKLPGLSDHTPPFLLWSNVAFAMTGRDVGVDFHWGPWGAVAYLAAVAAAVFVIAVVATSRRSIPE